MDIFKHPQHEDGFHPEWDGQTLNGEDLESIAQSVIEGHFDFNDSYVVEVDQYDDHPTQVIVRLSDVADQVTEYLPPLWEEWDNEEKDGIVRFLNEKNNPFFR